MQLVHEQAVHSKKMFSVLLFLYLFLIFASKQHNKFMKKILLLVTFCILGIAAISASEKYESPLVEKVQENKPTKIVSPWPNVELEIKRCLWNANRTVIIDFLITNNGQNDISFYLIGGKSKVYDDEGNVYSNIKVGVGGNYYSSEPATFPSDVPVKCKMEINNVDDMASMFTRINLYVVVNYASDGTFLINNLSIKKD